MFPRISLAWLLLLGVTQAAFIRYWPCDLREEALSRSRFEAQSLRGWLHDEHNGTVLSVQLLGDFIHDDCDELHGESAVLYLDAKVLGKSVIYSDPVALVGRCPTLPRHETPRYDSRTYAVYAGSFPLVHARHFITLDTEIQLRLNDTDISCLHASITPSLGTTISRSLIGIPLAIMLLSGLLTGFVHTYQTRRSSTFRYELDSTHRDPAECAFPGLGPCLQYIQFVFLTGCLTIPYPGFFRAAISHLAWSSLIFRNWPVTHQFAYPGIEDGIYSINATYGLEETAQFLGSTTTSDLWTNSLVNLALVGVGIAIAMQVVVVVVQWLRRQYVSRGSSSSQPGARFRVDVWASALHRTAWTIARLVLDDALHPLISFSLFQAHNARWFPGHTSMAMIIVAALAALRVLLLRHLIKTNRLALFIPHSFVAVPLANPALDGALLYGVPFVRGLAIGGLQQSGLAQSVLLAGCEVFVLAHAGWSWRRCAAGAPWRHVFAACARLVAVSLGVVFLPQVGASGRIRGAVAYFILALHASVVGTGFVLDCLLEPLRLFLSGIGVVGDVPRRADGMKPPVFGIKQLAHRSTRRVSFGRFPALGPDAPDHHSPPSSHTRNVSIRRHVPFSSSPPSTDLASAPSFRAPRPQTASPSISSSSYSQIPLSPGSATRENGGRSSQSGAGSGTGTEHSGDTIELQLLDTSIDAAVNSPEYYAQRESDQYYRFGRQEPCSRGEDSAQSLQAPSPSSRRVWPPWRVRGGKGKGFEVIRPAATMRGGIRGGDVVED